MTVALPLSKLLRGGEQAGGREAAGGEKAEALREHGLPSVVIEPEGKGSRVEWTWCGEARRWETKRLAGQAMSCHHPISIECGITCQC
jgi:hypothetical protein